MGKSRIYDLGSAIHVFIHASLANTTSGYAGKIAEMCQSVIDHAGGLVSISARRKYWGQNTSGVNPILPPIMNESASSHPYNDDDRIDFGEFFSRLKRGLPLIFGLAALGLAITASVYYASGALQTVATTSRIIFSFPGFEKGEYPDNSKFQPDDLRSPEIIAEALKRKGLDVSEETQSKVRAALSIEGIIPDNIAKERDKLRTTGQTPRLYVPDEYILTLSLPRSLPITARQRELLLNEIVSVYHEKFTRTYVTMPLSFGKAFETLHDVDYWDYDLVLKKEMQNINSFLTLMEADAHSYRSPRTNLSFSDLLKESQIFTEIRLPEVLGLIRRDGLSKDRNRVLMKMEYHLKSLEDDEHLAVENEKVVQSLLQQAQMHQQNYALGVKSQANQSKNDSLVVDQGLVDSLLANDAYNLLIRKALDAGLTTRGIQSQIAIVLERREKMESFLKGSDELKAETLAPVQKSIDALELIYNSMMHDIQQTYEDYQRQQFGDAIRMSMQAHTDSFYRGLAIAGIAGMGIGFFAGLGLSLLGIGLQRNNIL